MEPDALQYRPLPLFNACARIGAAMDERLDSWKKIASYLKRDVSTVQRWEKREGLPIHRLLHDKQGSVYAFRTELDAWWAKRSTQLARDDEPPQTATVAAARRSIPKWIPAGAAVAMVVGAGVWWTHQSEIFWQSPLADAQFRPLTEFEGTEHAAAISRDGRFVAFLSDHGGQLDAWLATVDSSDLRNLTQGAAHGFDNPLIRTLGFSADASLVSIWTREHDGSKPEDINIIAAPVGGGPLQAYLAGTAEFDWSSDGRQMVYHTTAPGDPIFIREAGHTDARQLHVGSTGIHCHFPIWSPDDVWIYFVRGVPPADWDIWRVHAEGGEPERITHHNSLVTHPVLLDRRTLLYLASDRDGSGPWLYAMDVERRKAHRVSPGLERYTSLSASADGTRLAATLASSKTSLWRVPIGDDLVAETEATRVALPSGGGASPRLTADAIVYVASHDGKEGVFRFADGTTAELWSARQARVIGAPGISPDGQHIAFSTDENGSTPLYVMDVDGKDVRVLSGTLTLVGNLAWAPDGLSLVSAAEVGGEPRLYRFALNGIAPTQLVGEYSVDPVWSPDGTFLVYSGADVGTTFPLRAAAADGRPHSLPSLILTRGARRVGFVYGSHALVVLRGDLDHKNFWLVDLVTGAERQLTDLADGYEIRDFDVSADGREIVFDRTRENSNIVLIDRAH
jgi:Tol biopolymer transport system component